MTTLGSPHTIPDRELAAREAADAAGVPLAHVYPGLKRLADRRQIFSPARGFYVPIPPEIRTWGSVPATHFVDAGHGHVAFAGFL
ncbi:MAG TPA: hypothetical protein PKE05_02945, partial [Microthrixaceae bacterium]|nr:hypothetical protein [Microthrixaceae bacterium]